MTKLQISGLFFHHGETMDLNHNLHYIHWYYKILYILQNAAVMIRENISSDQDLLEAIQVVLDRRGILSSLKAKIRGEVYHALTHGNHNPAIPPEKPKEIYLINELVRDYLICMRLNSTLSVLTEEIGQSGDMTVDREFLGGELGYNTINSDKDTPLLLLLVQQLMKQKSERELDDIKSIAS